LTTDEIKKAFSDISKSFNAKKIMVAVTGGEALLRPDVFEVMKYANGLGFPWGMVTNGTLITPEIIAKMKDSGMSSVSVSLDGLETNHTWQRIGVDTFRKVINGIKLLVAAKFPIVEAITCVNKRNIKELEEIYKLCRELGVTNWRMFSISPVGRAKENPEMFLSAEEWKYLLDYIAKKRKTEKKFKISFCEEGFFGPEIEGTMRDQFFFCWAGIKVGSILYNGDIGACPILPREQTRQGNVRTDDFAKVWNEKFKLFRDRDWRRCGKCESCLWWDFCQGNSLHLWDFDEKKLCLCHMEIFDKEKL
jgi:radical SAM protein with 4Fe4S-binding SPASM domain